MLHGILFKSMVLNCSLIHECGRPDLVIVTLQQQQLKVGNNPEIPQLTPAVCNDSPRPSVAWGVRLGIGPDTARPSICSFSTVKMSF